MTKQNYFNASAAVFTVVASAHLWRALAGWPVEVRGVMISSSISWLAFIVSGTLAYYGWKLGKNDK